MNKTRQNFENELGELVDRYLLDGLPGDYIKYVLNYEADYAYDERLKELKANRAALEERK